MEILRRNPHKSSWAGAARDVCSHMTVCATFCGVWHRRASWCVALQGVLGASIVVQLGLPRIMNVPQRTFIAVLWGTLVMTIEADCIYSGKFSLTRENHIRHNCDQDRDLGRSQK